MVLAVPATIRWCGIPATTTTRSRVRPVSIRWSSMAPMWRRTLTSQRRRRVRFFRNIASVTTDLNDVEEITFNAWAARRHRRQQPRRHRRQLRETQLGGRWRRGDAQPDAVIVQGGATNDTLSVSGSTTASSWQDADTVTITAVKPPTTRSRSTSSAATTRWTLRIDRRNHRPQGGWRPDDDLLIGSDGATFCGEATGTTWCAAARARHVGWRPRNNIVIQD